MATYFLVQDYVSHARTFLQDLIFPYRYDDNTLVAGLNAAMLEVSRIRPDIFLDLKYQRPIRVNDLNDGVPDLFDAAHQTVAVPIPGKYVEAVNWYISGWAQLIDVTDKSDQRAGAFLAKFKSILIGVDA